MSLSTLADLACSTDDRRMLREPMKRDWGIEASDENLTQCVRRFGVPKKEGDGEVSSFRAPSKRELTLDEVQITNHVVATKLSTSIPRDLLVSYSGAGVFLFDTDADPHIPPEPVVEPAEATYKEKEENDVLLSSDGESNESRSTVPEKRPREEDSPDQGSLPSISPHFEEATVDEEEEEGERNGTDSGDDSDDEEAFSRLDRFRSYHSVVPLISPRREYTGHRNETTVKDVNFAFGNDSFVVSGSDDGNWFVWDKESEELVGIFKGDDSGEPGKLVSVFVSLTHLSSLTHSRQRAPTSPTSSSRRHLGHRSHRQNLWTHHRPRAARQPRREG